MIWILFLLIPVIISRVVSDSWTDFADMWLEAAHLAAFCFMFIGWLFVFVHPLFVGIWGLCTLWIWKTKA